jgi:hypothetical protein
MLLLLSAVVVLLLLLVVAVVVVVAAVVVAVVVVVATVAVVVVVVATVVTRQRKCTSTAYLWRIPNACSVTTMVATFDWLVSTQTSTLSCSASRCPRGSRAVSTSAAPSSQPRSFGTRTVSSSEIGSRSDSSGSGTA